MLLIDQRPGEEPSYIEFSANAVAQPEEQAAAESSSADRHVALDANAAEVTSPPDAFEVSSRILSTLRRISANIQFSSSSTLLIMIRRCIPFAVGNVLLDCIQYYFLQFLDIIFFSLN